MSLDEYLTKHWLPLLTDRIKPTTLDAYKRMLYGYVIPRVGRVKLQTLSATHLNHLYTELRASGGTWQSKKQSGPKPLSQKTVRNVHAVVSKALNDAVDVGLVATNVAERAKPPRQRSVSSTVDAWTAPELGAFLAFVHDDRLFAAWHLSSHTGLRRGELLGLRWSDIDEERSTLSVRQTIVLEYTTPIFGTPKNHEARVVDIDATTLEVLRQHRQRQRVEAASWGEGYVDSELVFRRENGDLINPDSFSQTFQRLLRRSGVRRIKLHGLRHTHATLLLKAGVPVKVVSERLGHSDPAFTLRIYQHVLSGMQAEAAALFTSVIRAVLASADDDGLADVPPPPA